MAQYELSSVPFMGDQEPPFAIVTTDDNDVPVSIKHDPSADAQGQQLADELIANFTNDPSSFPLGRLALSYGGLKKIG